MKCPDLSQLPPPPPGKTGWPWTEATPPAPPTLQGQPWPKISVVTPSYNQGQFIEETIRSILLQGYPDLEYIIIDGGSTDNTLEIIQKYEPYLTDWISECDRGQSDALNKGFRKATGDLIGWQNSDDYYQPDALINAAQAAQANPEITVFYGPTQQVDYQGQVIRDYPVTEFALSNLLPYLNMCNQAMFWRQQIFQDNHFIDESYQHGMDQEFLVRLAIAGYSFQLVPNICGYYRVHAQAKGATTVDTCAADCLRIYQSVYQNPQLDLSVREQALNSIYGLCIDNFWKFRPLQFRQSYKTLLGLTGLQGIDWRLSLMYLGSFVDVQLMKATVQFLQQQKAKLIQPTSLANK